MGSFPLDTPLTNHSKSHSIQVHRAQLTTGPYTTYYAHAGSGDPVILLHGVGGDCSLFLELMSDLAAKRLVIAPDMIGHGKTSGPAGCYLERAYVRWFHDFVEGLGHSSIQLLGHSLGGAVAIRYAYHFPQQVKQLVLVNAVSLGIPSARATLLLLSAMFNPDRQRSLEHMGQVMFSGDELQRREMARRFLDEGRVPRGWRGFLWMLYRTWHVAQPVSNGVLERLGMPVLILWGEDDNYFPRPHALRATRNIKGSMLHFIPGAAHAPFLERPNEFKARLESFLQLG